MKIGIEAQRLFRPRKYGMEIVALEMIRQLQQIDLQNEYTVFARTDEDDQCVQPSSNFSVKNIPGGPYPYWEQLILPKAAKKEKLDILHCTANTAPLIYKRPLVITIHDITYLESMKFTGSSYQNFGNLYRRFIVPRVAKHATKIITVSGYEKTTIAKRLQIPEEMIRVVYNGVNPQFKPITDQTRLDAVRKKYDLAERFFLHFGNTAPKKNTIGVLKAHALYTKNVSDAIPLVITNCTQEFINGLLRQINEPSLSKNIVVLDYLAAADIPVLHNLAAVLLYPSFDEGFGMPVIEAMSCGTPVITSNTSALPEIAGGAASIIDPYNSDEIAEAMMKLLSDAVSYNSHRELGFQNAKRFSWRNTAEQALAVYNEFR